MKSEQKSEQIRQLLKDSSSIAIVGVSDKSDRPSFGVAKYLIENSHLEVFLVNPMIDSLFGRPVYKTLQEVPGSVDIVDVFRKVSDIPGVYEAAREIGVETLWLQLGLSHPEIAASAVAAGMNVVMDRCTKIEYEALLRSA